MGGQSIWSSGRYGLCLGSGSLLELGAGTQRHGQEGQLRIGSGESWSRCSLQAEGLADGLANMACGFTVVVCPRDLRESNFDYIFNTV